MRCEKRPSQYYDANPEMFVQMFLRLECDQECATLERNRRLAEALQIDSSSDPFNVRSTSAYSSSLKEDARFVFDICDVINLVVGKLIHKLQTNHFTKNSIFYFLYSCFSEKI